MSTGFNFMAVAAGRESTEGSAVKRYIGVAPVFVLTVNPSKEELEKIYGVEIEKDPEYLGEMEVGDDKHKVPNLRFDFIVKTDAAKCGIEFTTKVALFLRNEVRYNKDKTKCQVIDKYGRTTWVTPEQLKGHVIPLDKNGNPLQIDADYRPAYEGEENLTNFIKAYLNIPNPMSYVNGKWVENPKVKAEECECRLEHISDYFKGDISEIKSITTFQPNNKVKILFGVRNTDDNKQYQAAYVDMFLKNNVTDYSKLDAHMQDRKSHGAYPHTEFKVEDLKEYNVEATDFSAGGNLPFAEPTGATPWGNKQ